MIFFQSDFDKLTSAHYLNEITFMGRILKIITNSKQNSKLVQILTENGKNELADQTKYTKEDNM